MFSDNSLVLDALAHRNALLTSFWFDEPEMRFLYLDADLLGKRVLVIDAEDTFTKMLGVQLAALGLKVEIRRFDSQNLLAGVWDMVVMGPGPGDPSDPLCPRMKIMRSAIRELLELQQPFLAICLSHQILCLELGLSLTRRAKPNQGVQSEIDFFGQRELVGFYNTYIAKHNHPMHRCRDGLQVKVSRSLLDDEVYGLRGGNFSSMQFHPESILTKNGINIIASSVKEILKK